MQERRFIHKDRRQKYDLDYFINGGKERRKRLYIGRRMGEELHKKFTPLPKIQDSKW